MNGYGNDMNKYGQLRICGSILTTFATFATLLHTGGECSPTRRGGYHPPVPLTYFFGGLPRTSAPTVRRCNPALLVQRRVDAEGRREDCLQNRAKPDGRAMPVPTGDRYSRGRSRLPVPLTTFATFATLLHTGGECSPTRRGGYHPPVPLTCFYGGASGIVAPYKSKRAPVGALCCFAYASPPSRRLFRRMAEAAFFAPKLY